MWFATQDGISRFDGKSYINLNSYNADSKRKILGTDVFDIKPDVTGNYLWALSAYGGLNKIELTTCNVAATYQIEQSVKPDTTLWYKCLSENDNYLIIGTNEGVISRFNKASGKTENSFSLTDKFNCPGQLEDIFIDSLNRVWYFVSGTGVLITDAGLSKKMALIPSSQINEKPFVITDFAISNNLVLLTTTNGLGIIDMKTLAVSKKRIAEPQYVSLCNNQELHCISVAGEQAIITGKNLLYKVQLTTGKTESIQLSGNFEDRSWITLTNAVYSDKQSIWLGSQYGVGWIRNINSPFVAYYNSMNGSNIKISHAITICAASASSILVCGDDGLYDLDPATAIIRKFGVEDFYYSVFKAPNGYFIASGVSKGMQLFNTQFKPLSISTVFPELNAIKSDLIMCSAKFGDSVVFMASQNKNGLYIWNTVTKRIQVISTRTGKLSLRNDNINRLFIDSRNRLWIICENTIAIYDYFTNSILHLPLTDPSTNQAMSINMDICETKNSFWIASYGTGIVELSKDFKIQRIYTSRDGIKNLGLYKIFAVSDTILLASSNNGLLSINTKTDNIKNYFTEDGLQSNSFEEASGDRLADNIFTGGINGITKIDIPKLNTNPGPAKLTFSTISLISQKKMIDTLDIGIKRLIIPQNISQVNINFSAINYLDPEKLKYAYKLTENDKEWNITDKNFIQFFRLSPGTYHLQVQAFNEDGVGSEIKELTLIFLPKWYQTWWFKTLIGLCFVAICYGLYRLRINHLKKEEKIRNQLASDLHDDLGSTLNSVKVYSNLAMMEKENPQHLLRIKESTQEAIAGVRDLIWVLDDKKDTVQDLFARINQFAAPLCEANHINYVQHIDDNLYHYKLGKEEKRNLYMIIKESVNNSIKYAGCKTIELKTTSEGKKIQFSVRDDGKGFDKGKIKAGNGLKNITARAKEIGYTSSIIAREGNGTIIELKKARL